MIEAAGKVGRQPDRDKLLVTMLYRHGLRLSEKACHHQVPADLQALVDAGRVDVPMKHLKFRMWLGVHHGSDLKALPVA